jgi:hypothetical protein
MQIVEYVALTIVGLMNTNIFTNIFILLLESMMSLYTNNINFIGYGLLISLFAKYGYLQMCVILFNLLFICMIFVLGLFSSIHPMLKMFNDARINIIVLRYEKYMNILTTFKTRMQQLMGENNIINKWYDKVQNVNNYLSKFIISPKTQHTYVSNKELQLMKTRMNALMKDLHQ